MDIGERLKRERERLGYTIPALAEVAGAGKNTFIDWQNNRSSPPAEKLAALAKAGVDVQFVLIGVRSLSPLGMQDDQAERMNALIDDFQALPEEDQEKVIAWVGGLRNAALNRGTASYVRHRRSTHETLHEPPSPTYAAPAQVFHGPVGQAAAGDLINEGRAIKQRRGRK